MVNFYRMSALTLLVCSVLQAEGASALPNQDMKQASTWRSVGKTCLKVGAGAVVIAGAYCLGQHVEARKHLNAAVNGFFHGVELAFNDRAELAKQTAETLKDYTHHTLFHKATSAETVFKTGGSALPAIVPAATKAMIFGTGKHKFILGN